MSTKAELEIRIIELQRIANIVMSERDSARASDAKQVKATASMQRQRDVLAVAMAKIADAAYGTDTPKLRETARIALIQYLQVA